MGIEMTSHKGKQRKNSENVIVHIWLDACLLLY